MKNCPICGTDAADDAVKCASCEYNFANLGPALGAAPATSDDVGTMDKAWGAPQRPSGLVPMGVGWACLALAVVLFLYSLGVGPDTFDVEMASKFNSADSAVRVAQAAGLQSVLQLAAGGFFSLFLVFLGYWVRRSGDQFSARQGRVSANARPCTICKCRECLLRRCSCDSIHPNAMPVILHPTIMSAGSMARPTMRARSRSHILRT